MSFLVNNAARLYARSGHRPKSLLCFLLIFVLSFTSVPMAFADPESPPVDESSQEQLVISGQGGITTDLAPEIRIEVTLDASAADEEDARALLARATPQQREELLEFYAQLDALDRETEIAVEEYNAARMRLEAVSGNIEVSAQDVAILGQAYEVQADQLGMRASELYRGGPEVFLRLLFDATSLSDLMDRINLATQLINADSDLMSRIRGQRSRLETSIQQLEADQLAAASLEFEMRARMIEVTARNEDRKRELQEQNETLILLWEAEELQRRADEQRLAIQVAEGTTRDIVLTPGSPVETAMALRGIPYLWGGASRRGFDCSGLIRFVFAQHGINLPHHSASQALHGARVEGSLQPGDIVFFGTPIHHVGMYVGGGYFIHSPRSGEVVSLRSLASRSDMVAARRFDWQPREGAPR